MTTYLDLFRAAHTELFGGSEQTKVSFLGGSKYTLDGLRGAMRATTNALPETLADSDHALSAARYVQDHGRSMDPIQLGQYRTQLSRMGWLPQGMSNAELEGHLTGLDDPGMKTMMELLQKSRAPAYQFIPTQSGVNKRTNEGLLNALDYARSRTAAGLRTRRGDLPDSMIEDYVDGQRNNGDMLARSDYDADVLRDADPKTKARWEAAGYDTSRNLDGTRLETASRPAAAFDPDAYDMSRKAIKDINDRRAAARAAGQNTADLDREFEAATAKHRQLGQGAPPSTTPPTPPTGGGGNGGAGAAPAGTPPTGQGQTGGWGRGAVMAAGGLGVGGAAAYYGQQQGAQAAKDDGRRDRLVAYGAGALTGYGAPRVMSAAQNWMQARQQVQPAATNIGPRLKQPGAP